MTQMTSLSSADFIAAYPFMCREHADRALTGEYAGGTITSATRQRGKYVETRYNVVAPAAPYKRPAIERVAAPAPVNVEKAQVVERAPVTLPEPGAKGPRAICFAVFASLDRSKYPSDKEAKAAFVDECVKLGVLPGTSKARWTDCVRAAEATK